MDWCEDTEYGGYWKRTETLGDFEVIVNAYGGGWYLEIDRIPPVPSLQKAKTEADALVDLLRPLLMDVAPSPKLVADAMRLLASVAASSDVSLAASAQLGTAYEMLREYTTLNADEDPVRLHWRVAHGGAILMARSLRHRSLYTIRSLNGAWVLDHPFAVSSRAAEADSVSCPTLWAAIAEAERMEGEGTRFSKAEGSR